MIRLNKYIANAGVCNRREADKLILSGKIMVNGQVVTILGTKVNVEDKVEYNGKLLTNKKFQYILLNKPKGFYTSLDGPVNNKTPLNLIGNSIQEQLFPVGELDVETMGLLLITNDIELAKRVSDSEQKINEKYILHLDKEMDSETLELLKKGIKLKERVYCFDKVHYGDKGENKKKLIVTISHRTKNIISRLIEHLGYKVITLDRIEFHTLKKGSLSRGKWRLLTAKEIGFFKMIKDSS